MGRESPTIGSDTVSIESKVVPMSRRALIAMAVLLAVATAATAASAVPAPLRAVSEFVLSVA